jgi:predicted DNA-binding protein (MmcQ/YjbR family)
MAKHNLTGSLETKFTFAIDDKEFEFRKPTVREMRVIAKQFAGLEKIEDEEEKIKASEEAMSELYKFVEPIGHKEKVEELLLDQPMGVQAAFNNMIKEELGA